MKRCEKCKRHKWKDVECGCKEYEFKYGEREDFEDYNSVYAQNYEDAIDTHLGDYDSSDGYPTEIITVRCEGTVKTFSCEAEFSVDWYKTEI